MELTPSEVVALFGLDERRVRKDVEHGVFDRGKSPPRFALAEVVYLFAVAALGVDDHKKLYRLIAAALAQRTPPEIIELGAYLEVRLASAVHDVEGRLERFATWKKKLVTRDDILGGEPVFPNSRFAVRQIARPWPAMSAWTASGRSASTSRCVAVNGRLPSRGHAATSSAW